MSRSIHWWRAAALLGVSVVLRQQAISALPLKPRQAGGGVVLVLASLGVLLTLAAVLPRATRRLLRCPDLLVPLGLYVLAQGVLGWLLLLPATAAVFAPSWSGKFIGLGFAVSLAVVVSIALGVAYGTWETLLILSAVEYGRADPPRMLPGVRRWFWRVLGLEVIGWGVLFLGLAMVIPLAVACLPVVLIVLLVGSILWNLATAALLPVALDGRLRFGEALRQGIRLSWRGKGRWWTAVVAQLVLQGLVTFVAVSYSDNDPKGGTYRTYQKTNWSVNAFWTGGYDDECRWYGKLMEALDAPKTEVISTLLGLAFGVLAIAVKLRIIEQLMPPAEAVYEPPPDDAFTAEPPALRGATAEWPSQREEGITTDPGPPP